MDRAGLHPKNQDTSIRDFFNQAIFKNVDNFNLRYGRSAPRVMPHEMPAGKLSKCPICGKETKFLTSGHG